MLILAFLIATGIPAIFLILIYTLDLYASRSFRLVLVCFGWGAIGGLLLAYLFNTYIALPLIAALGLSHIFLYVLFAPVAEELFKSASLFYVRTRPEFTYFVDGAIYGFAAGIGFSITENVLYLTGNPSGSIPLALIRSFSTCLMHGTAAGLVGVALGYFRLQKRSGRWLAVSGWLGAILLHAAFNGVANSALAGGALGTIVAVVIGLAGVGLIAVFIQLGLRQQQQWMGETLNRQVGVTGAERRAAQSLANLDELIEPITKQFPKKAEQIQALVLLQAQIGIKRKVEQKIDDPKLKAQLGQEIAQARAEMEKLRKQIGFYAMTNLRMVFPDGMLDVWARLEAVALQSGPADLKRWDQLLSGAAPGTPSKRSIFASVGGGTSDTPS